MRVFVALDIPGAVREKIARFMDEVREFAPQARWLQPESLHITLKFIGEKQPPEVESIKKALAEIHGERYFQVIFRGCGFFPDRKSARVFWAGIQENADLMRLAKSVDERCGRAGVAREERDFSPHLTLARAGRSGAPHRTGSDRKNRVFEKLQEQLAEPESLEFGTMVAREFILFQSKLSPRGAQYTELARFALAQS